MCESRKIFHGGPRDICVCWKKRGLFGEFNKLKFSGGGGQNGVKQIELLTHTHKSSDITARASLGRVKYFLFLTD